MRPLLRFVPVALAFLGIAACAGPDPRLLGADHDAYYQASFDLAGELRYAYFPRSGPQDPVS